MILIDKIKNNLSRTEQTEKQREKKSTRNKYRHKDTLANRNSTKIQNRKS